MKSMTQLAGHEAEVGWNSTVNMVEGKVVKVSPLKTTYASESEAWGVASGLRTYADELAGQPLQTASLLGVDVVKAEGGYKVQHSYEHVDGPSLTRLGPEELRPAMATLLGQVALMDTYHDRNTLVVPFDAKSDNFHVVHDPTLIDIFPAVSRRPDGSFPTDLFPGEPSKGGFVSWALGTKSGAMTMLLSTAVDRGDTPISKLGHILRKTDDWAYDVLPIDVDAKVKAAVRRQIGSHFIPFLAYGATKRANNKRQQFVHSVRRLI